MKCALPFYHLYAMGCLVFLHSGGGGPLDMVLFPTKGIFNWFFPLLCEPCRHKRVRSVHCCAGKMFLQGPI